MLLLADTTAESESGVKRNHAIFTDVPLRLPRRVSILSSFFSWVKRR
jgi:hypothetical protein